MGYANDVWTVLGHGITGVAIDLGATVGSYLVTFAGQAPVWDPALNTKVVLLMIVLGFLKGVLKRIEPEVPAGIVGARGKVAKTSLKAYLGL